MTSSHRHYLFFLLFSILYMRHCLRVYRVLYVFVTLANQILQIERASEKTISGSRINRRRREKSQFITVMQDITICTAMGWSTGVLLSLIIFKFINNTQSNNINMTILALIPLTASLSSSSLHCIGIEIGMGIFRYM